MGGTSNEREVSLESGKNVAAALASLHAFEVVPVVLDADDLSPLPDGVDACYIALHGGWGENGGVQAALDSVGIPYTGPGAEACRITMDKIATKRCLESAGLPVPRWTVNAPMSVPCVVKAPRDGSSVGVYLVKSSDAFEHAMLEAKRIDREKFGGEGEVLVEEFIPGREMTVGVLDGEVFPAVEICAPGGWYGYDAKYYSNETLYPFPEDAFVPDMQHIAIEAFRACCCRGIVRVDFRVTPEGKPYILELNSSPGMTSHSLVPKAAAKSGISMPMLCERILRAAAHD